MNKRRLHHIWTKIRLISPWYFLALAFVSGFVAVNSLRANNEHMIKLREAVVTADMSDKGVQPALQALQSYVTRHMNTNLSTANNVYPPVQLKYTYDRLVRAQSDALAKANSELYSAAQALCEQQNSKDFSGRNRVPCIEEYVRTHAPAAVKHIPDALYKFAFTSPSWSPDLAGWSLVATVLSASLFVITLVARLWFKHNVA